MHSLSKYIREVQDFPQKGILFRDIAPLLEHKFNEAIDGLIKLIGKDSLSRVSSIAGIESRGFILAAGIAAKTGKGIIPIRKKGKLPGNVLRMEYELEYGTDCLEMNQGEGSILLIDDVLATGGTLNAGCKLLELSNYTIEDIVVLINLTSLNNFKWNDLTPKYLINYD